MHKILIVCLFVFLLFVTSGTEGSPPWKVRVRPFREHKLDSESTSQDKTQDFKISPDHDATDTDHKATDTDHKATNTDHKATDTEGPLNSDSSQPSEESTRPKEESPELVSLRESADQDYVYFEAANGYFKLHRNPAAWSDARLICFDEGAELASPENETLLAAMSKILLTIRHPPLYVFTGINDLYSKGYFTSLRGTSLSSMPAYWAPREPDNVNHGHNCLVMQRNGLLLDSKCDDAYPYMCYKKQLTSQINLCGTADKEYVYNKHTKSCYKIHPEFLSWQDAYATCSREGGYLAILNSDYEAKTLARLIKHEWIWAHIGFSYWRKDLWVTIHGQTISEAGFDTWTAGEPNDYNEERCGALAADIGTLVDIDCEDHARPFICEISNLK